jgi:hypothetical protein
MIRLIKRLAKVKALKAILHLWYVTLKDDKEFISFDGTSEPLIKLGRWKSSETYQNRRRFGWTDCRRNI